MYIGDHNTVEPTYVYIIIMYIIIAFSCTEASIKETNIYQREETDHRNFLRTGTMYGCSYSASSALRRVISSFSSPKWDVFENWYRRTSSSSQRLRRFEREIETTHL